jgi:hypothetical protein
MDDADVAPKKNSKLDDTNAILNRRTTSGRETLNAHTIHLPLLSDSSEAAIPDCNL